MAKYEFKMKALDDFELVYTNKDNEEKTIPFKRTVSLASKLQNIDADARFKMFEYLTSHGKSKKDFIIERKDENGKIVVDETNYREFETNFVRKAQFKTIRELYKELFNMTLEEIIVEVGLEEDEAFVFGTKLREILINGVQDDKIPSKDEA